MRLHVAALALSIAAAPVWAAEDQPLSGLVGPAAGAMRSYLNSEKTGCPDDDERTCSLAEIAVDTRVFYGRFPDREGSFALLFLGESTGGSGVNQTAIVWKGDPRGSFSLIGQTEAMGAEPKNVKFLQKGRITYMGTVMRPGDVHAAPSGHRSFQLMVDDGKVTAIDR